MLSKCLKAPAIASSGYRLVMLASGLTSLAPAICLRLLLEGSFLPLAFGFWRLAVEEALERLD